MAGSQQPENFRVELAELVNRYSLENKSDTPDFVLAVYIEQCLAAFDLAVVARDAFHGFKPFKKHGGQ